jgi:hypothetical protein
MCLAVQPILLVLSFKAVALVLGRPWAQRLAFFPTWQSKHFLADWLVKLEQDWPQRLLQQSPRLLRLLLVRRPQQFQILPFHTLEPSFAEALRSRRERLAWWALRLAFHLVLLVQFVRQWVFLLAAALFKPQARSVPPLTSPLVVAKAELLRPLLLLAGRLHSKPLRICVSEGLPLE